MTSAQRIAALEARIAALEKHLGLDKQFTLFAEEPPVTNAHAYSEAFETFWAAYPNKVAKREAYVAWTTIPARPRLGVILAAISIQKDSPDWRKNKGQFIPHPATWLRAGQWEDEGRQTEREETERTF